MQDDEDSRHPRESSPARRAFPIRATLLGGLLLAAAAVRAAEPARVGGVGSPAAAASWAEGDAALEARLAEAAQVERQLPPPGLAEYLTEVSQRLTAWLFRRGSSLLERLGWRAEKLVVVVRVLLVLLLLAVAWLVLRALLFRRRSTLTLSASRATEVPEAQPPTRDEWLVELEARLADEDVVRALRALWWWLAYSLSPERVDAAWTSGELVRAAGRGDLAPLTGRLDALLYGAVAPSVEDVRRLRSRLEGALA